MQEIFFYKQRKVDIKKLIFTLCFHTGTFTFHFIPILILYRWPLLLNRVKSLMKIIMSTKLFYIFINHFFRKILKSKINREFIKEGKTDLLSCLVASTIIGQYVRYDIFGELNIFLFISYYVREEISIQFLLKYTKKSETIAKKKTYFQFKQKWQRNQFRQ